MICYAIVVRNMARGKWADVGPYFRCAISSHPRFGER